MALFLKQAKEVDIIITTALIRKFKDNHITDHHSWETCTPVDSEGTR
jgi:hypothetical protein